MCSLSQVGEELTCHGADSLWGLPGPESRAQSGQGQAAGWATGEGEQSVVEDRQ